MQLAVLASPKICDALFAAGADVLTTGNHVWDKKEIIDYIGDGRLLRPLNMIEGTPGKGIGAGNKCRRFAPCGGQYHDQPVHGPE